MHPERCIDTADFALMGSRAVRQLLNNCSQMHLWRLTNDPRYRGLGFPKPTKINGRKYFRVAEVRQWLLGREVENSMRGRTDRSLMKRELS